jgi:hypothetical protein
LLLPSHVATAQDQSLSDLNLKSLQKKEEALQWGRDPFVLPDRETGSGGAGEGEFRLSAIIYREGKGVAIINNRIVRTGDVLEGMEVAEIRQDRVILKSASGDRELRVDRFLIGP